MCVGNAYLWGCNSSTVGAFSNAYNSVVKCKFHVNGVVTVLHAFSNEYSVVKCKFHAYKLKTDTCSLCGIYTEHVSEIYMQHANKYTWCIHFPVPLWYTWQCAQTIHIVIDTTYHICRHALYHANILIHLSYNVQHYTCIWHGVTV